MLHAEQALTTLAKSTELEGGNDMLVYVLNKHGQPLMPCKPQKARKLLEQGKAKVITTNTVYDSIELWI